MIIEYFLTFEIDIFKFLYDYCGQPDHDCDLNDKIHITIWKSNDKHLSLSKMSCLQFLKITNIDDNIEDKSNICIWLKYGEPDNEYLNYICNIDELKKILDENLLGHQVKSVEKISD